MQVSFVVITGIAFGLEYVAQSIEEGIDFPTVILDFVCFRWVFEFTGQD